MLMDHADARARGVRGIGEVTNRPVDEDLPRIWLDNPRGHSHQRRLARAVLSYESVDFTGKSGEVHALIGNNVPEPPGYSSHLQ